MPRRARQLSNSNIYHVMVRGINHQCIFDDDSDRERLLWTLHNYRKDCKCNILAWCFMDNHFHLLIQITDAPLDTVIKKINVSYVYYYNGKNGRSGHLFQDRFRSEPIESDAQLLSVMRYIHRNPIVAGICDEVQDYYWSSYHEYIDRQNKPIATDVEFVMGIISADEFVRYNKESSDDRYLDMPNRPCAVLSDEQAKNLMNEVSGCKNTSDFQLLDRDSKSKFISTLHMKGAGINQLCRITGCSKTVVYRAIRS